MKELLLAIAIYGSGACIQIAAAQTQSQTLVVSDGKLAREYSVKDLLANRALQEITISQDPTYRRSMTYRAVPVSYLLTGLTVGLDDYVQVRAIDNFSVSIPGRLLKSSEKAEVEAFLAVEPFEAPWPLIPGVNQKTSAGPFYIVWHFTNRDEISSEYWAYRVASLKITDSPYKRWPGLVISDDVSSTDSVRRGLDRFVAVCMACHRFNGDGEADLGPDLGKPMNPVQYFQRSALRKYIRNPSSIREWPDQKMPGFDELSLSDTDIDAIIEWLTYKARKLP